jgi:hypothetical protein
MEFELCEDEAFESVFQRKKINGAAAYFLKLTVFSTS